MRVHRSPGWPAPFARALLLCLLAMVTPACTATSRTDVDGCLRDAASRGDADAVRQAIEDGAALEARDGQGRTALLLATHGNNVDAARELVEAGADVNAKDALQDSAYLYAGARGLDEILAMTLAHGADLRSTNRYGGTALIPAAERGHVATVRTLLRAGVAVDHVNRLHWTALLEAILLGDGGARHVQIVQLLLEGAGDEPRASSVRVVSRDDDRTGVAIDRVTGLPDASELREDLGRAIAANDPGRSVVALLIDLDRFRSINYAWGLEAGDRVLRKMAGTAAVGARGPGAALPAGAGRVRGRPRGPAAGGRARRARRPVPPRGPVPPRLRGATPCPSRRASARRSIRGTRTTRGPSSAAPRPPPTHRRSVAGTTSSPTSPACSPGQSTSWSWSEASWVRSSAGSSGVHYQPQVEVGSGKVTGLEALVRWQHPSFGLMRPAQFLRVSDELGFMEALDGWVPPARLRPEPRVAGPRPVARPHLGQRVESPARAARPRGHGGAGPVDERPRPELPPARVLRERDPPGSRLERGPLRGPQGARDRDQHRQLRDRVVLPRPSAEAPGRHPEDRSVLRAGPDQRPEPRHRGPVDHRARTRPRPPGRRRGSPDRGAAGVSPVPPLRRGPGLLHRSSPARPSPWSASSAGDA